MVTKKNLDVFRILDKNGLIKYTGSNIGSWFTLEKAKKLVNKSQGEKIYEYSNDYMNKMWEVL